MEKAQLEAAPKAEVLSESPEVVKQRFDDIVEQIDTVAQTPELINELDAIPLQKNTGLSDKPLAYR